MLNLQVNISFYSKRSAIGVKNTIVTVIAGGNVCAIFYGENTAVIGNTVDTITVSRNVCTALNRKAVILRGVVVFAAGVAVDSVIDGVVDAAGLIIVCSDMCAALNEEKACCY